MPPAYGHCMLRQCHAALGCAAVVACVAAARVGAQPTAGAVNQTVLRLAVDDATTGQPVSGARVVLVSQSATRRSDDLGRATFANVAVGYQRVRVTALGYRPVNKLIAVSEVAVGDSSATLIDLEAIAQSLDTVTTEAMHATSTLDLDAGGFDMRRKTGIGHFLDTDQIDREAWRSSLAQMIAEHVAGMRNSGGEIFSVRGPTQGILSNPRSGGCKLDVYVDGVHQSDKFKLGEVDPGDVAAMEVYTMVETPPQFKASPNGYSSGAAECGVLALWRRL